MALKLSRAQILAFRRRTNGLEERAPKTDDAFRCAAWAGLQDSMPRAAVVSLHARVEGIEPSDWEHPSLAQLWGPRYQVYVVPKADFALFSVGRHPDARAEEMAKRLHAHLGRTRQTDREVGQAIGVGNGMRYATTTGTIAIRWAGARAPVIWQVPRPEISPADACRELARRYLRVFGPSTASRFARWAGISQREGAAAFARLELLAVRTPLGDEWLLPENESDARKPAAGSTRLLPSGDAYWLYFDEAERMLVVPEADRRARLWTSRVWPGALLVDGELRGTWRRAQHKLQIETWTRLTRAQRDAVEAEARTLPLPLERAVDVVWG
ncbi:MAG TPA: crosslink repair DNA glycosylase YcaQ family protein [Gaiellaceae bacterium]